MEKFKKLIKIPKDKKEELQTIADKEGISLTTLINLIINNYLKEKRSVKNGEQFTNIQL